MTNHRIMYVVKKPHELFAVCYLCPTPERAWRVYFANTHRLEDLDDHQLRHQIKRAISLDGVRVCIVEVRETGVLPDKDGP